LIGAWTGIGANWAIVAVAKGKGGDLSKIVGVTVGFAMANLCNAEQGQQPNSRLRRI
jgi:hypothetical protein